jgi:hypothetical protein
MILIQRITCIVCVSLLASFSLKAQTSRWNFSLSSGYQSENFRWSIAGNIQGTSPNIYSELRWKNLAGPLVEAAADWNFWRTVHIHSVFSRLFITSGSVTDMDYQGDNRTNRSYYGAFDANKGMSFSWRTTLENQLLKSRVLTLTYCLGYALHKQSLFLLSSDQTGAAAGLRSTYDTRYQGVVIGMRGKVLLGARFSLEGSVFYDWVSFRGQADWNLISTFQHPLSFEDRADGFNLEGDLKFVYALQKKWALFLSADILHSETGSGTDMLYLQNGQSTPTQYNGAVRDYIKGAVGVRLSIP